MAFTFNEVIEAVLWVKTKQCHFCGIIVTTNKPVVHGGGCESENVAKTLKQLFDGRSSNEIAQSNNDAAAERIIPLRRKRTMTPQALAALGKARRVRMAKLAAQKEELRKTWNGRDIKAVNMD